MPTSDRLSDFVKSAACRLKDSEELIAPPSVDPQRSDASTRHLRGAMYLAGYAAECLLRAYLIAQEGCQTLAEAEARINRQRVSRGQETIERIARTAAGRDIEYLLRLTDLSTRPGYDAVL